MGSTCPPSTYSKTQRRSSISAGSEVQLTDCSTPPSVIESQVFSAAGMTAQRVLVPSKAGMDFFWKGPSHYLALHDLNHVDAETFADGQPVDRRRDLRGRLTFAPADSEVRGWSIATSDAQSFTALYLDPQHMENEMEERLRHLPRAVELYFTDDALRPTLEKLGQGLRNRACADAMYLESLCLIAMLELCLHGRESHAGATTLPGRLAKSSEQRLAAFVEANLARDIGLDDLARIAGLSRFHFVRTFQKTTGDTPYRYVLNRRIERAQRLLKTTSMSVSDVAIAVGFKEATRLIRAFRRSTGLTPAVYRSSK